MALTRSQQMARIKGKDTRPEKLLRSALWQRGLRYRLDARVPVGRPDIVFPGKRLAVFVDGCFWHGCPLHYVRPRTRCDFWAGKLAANVDRDRRHTLALEAAGWTVVRLWEHEVTESIDLAADRVCSAARGDPPPPSASWRVHRVDCIDEARDRERRTLVDLRDPCWTRSEDGPRVGRGGRRQAPQVARENSNRLK